MKRSNTSPVTERNTLPTLFARSWLTHAAALSPTQRAAWLKRFEAQMRLSEEAQARNQAAVDEYRRERVQARPTASGSPIAPAPRASKTSADG